MGLCDKKKLKKPSLTGRRNSSSSGYPYYRHSLPVRITHWFNAIFLVILLMSGLNIFNVHPVLYIGKSSYNGVSPVFEISGENNNGNDISGITSIFGHDFRTTGFLGASKGPEGKLVERAFPSWLTIPENRWLAMARRWHFFFAWLFVINGIVYMVYSISSRHFYEDLFPTKQNLKSIGRSFADHLRLRRPSAEESMSYNVIQKITYLGVIFILTPIMILMGLGMSPALNAVLPGWVDIFFGRQSIRTFHFIIAWALILFVIIHIFEVIVNGFWNNFRSMITGYFKVKSEKKEENK